MVVDQFSSPATHFETGGLEEKFMRVSALLLMVLLPLTLKVQSQSLKVVKEQTLPLAQEVELKSAILDSPPKLNVYLPEGYHESAEHIRYPLILTMDGWALSQSVAGVVSHLGKTASMPKAIVIAIDCDQDYAWGPEIYASESGWKVPKEQRLEGFSSGGADKHLQFLQQELLPFIDQRYRTNDFRILIGMSPSAAFALHTFWKAPEMFDAHFVFAATDVIGMGYTPDSTFIDKMAQSLAKTPERKGYLYVGSAKREADDNPARYKSVAALKKAFAPYTNENFHLKVEHIADFGHYPMALPGLLNAIDLVFPRKDFDMSSKFKTFLAQEDPFLALTDYYDKLSDQVGFKIYPNADLRRNANSLRVAGYRLRNQKKYDASEKVYRLWLDIQPTSIKAWYGMGALYEAQNHLEKAKEFFVKAHKLAQKQRSPLIEITAKKVSAD